MGEEYLEDEVNRIGTWRAVQESRRKMKDIFFTIFFFAKVYITELTAIFINNVREHLFFKTFGLINNLYLHSVDMIFTGIWNPDTRQTPEIQHIQTSPTSLIRT